MIIFSYFIRISIVIFIAVTESISQNSYCFCRPIDECLNEIQNNLKNFKYIAIFSPCESSNGIKCCNFLHISANDLFSCASQNTSREKIKCILRNALKTIHLINSFGQTKHSLLIKKLVSEILPFVNSKYLEYIGPTTELKSTESYNSKEIDVDALQAVQYTTAATKSLVQSLVGDAFYSNADLETDVTATNLTDDFPEKIISSPVGFIKTDAQSTISSTENEHVQDLRNNTDSNPSIPKQEIYIDENKKYSPRLQLINEATNFERVRTYPQNRQSDASKEQLTSTTNIDSTRLDHYINNCGITEELLEFDKNANETNARYEKQSMISMSKDVPTTPAVNSFEQKTPSETFLSLDRISTQPINKNTPTNKSKAPKNNGDISVFTIIKRSPSFSENAQKNKKFAIRCKINPQLIRDSRNKLQGETSGNHRVFPLIENTAEITPMLRRDDPLQASTRNKRMTAPIVSQKDILNKNTEEAEYKNNTTQKKNTKLSLQNNQSKVAINEGRKGSTDENGTKDSVNATLSYVQKFRFPPKLLPLRSKLHKKKNNSSTKYGKIQNLNRFSSSRFQHFYEAKEGLLSKINNITVEKTKPTRFEFLSKASRAYLSNRKNEKILKKSETRHYAYKDDVKASNVSALNDSISMNKNDSYEYSASNLQNASFASNKIASHLNASSQEIEKSMQTKAMYNNDTESSTPENNSKVLSEKIMQKITENLRQLSNINRGIIVTHILIILL